MALIKFTTEITAIDPADGVLKKWQGPHVVASSWKEARKNLDQNGLGYCRVAGQLVGEIDIESIEIDKIKSYIVKSN